MTQVVGKSQRFRLLETNLELELKPLARRDTIGLWLIFASLCVEACGAVLLFGGVWLRVRGQTPWTGLWLVLGGIVAFSLVLSRLQPHKAAKHASHRIRFHARKLRLRRPPAEPTMTDAQFDALEDEVDRLSAKSPT